MVKKKGKSKRMTFKQKYKIERKVKEHKKKQKKETRRRAKLGLPPMGIGQRKKANSIPNSWPFKEELLEQLATAKIRMEEEKQRKKEEVIQRRKQALVGSDVSDLVNQAAARAQSFAESQEELQLEDGSATTTSERASSNNDMRNLGQQSRRAFIRDLKAVVENADVILQVLDARDPLGSRSEAVEELILRRPEKKLVLVLNKVDLVPRDIVTQWLTYLRGFHPTVAFKSVTQEQRSSLSQYSGDASKVKPSLLSRSGSVGTEALIQLLKNYCRSLDIKTAVTVGIVGYPNVGKSSLINSLKRSKSVGVSSTPGFTRSMQEVQLDRHIKLLDSPGIVFDDDDVEGVLLRNCVNVDTLPDPSQAVQAMLRRCRAEDLMIIYSLPRFDPNDVQGFLALLAKKLGKLLKGGVPDRNAAARLLLRDWNTGKVPFYTKPPSDVVNGTLQQRSSADGVIAEEAKLLVEADLQVMDFLQDQDTTDFVALENDISTDVKKSKKKKKVKDIMLMNDDDEEEEEAVGRSTSAKKKRNQQEKQITFPEDNMEEENTEKEYNLQINQTAKKKLKAQKKKEKKVTRRTTATEMDQDYDWTTDFAH